MSAVLESVPVDRPLYLIDAAVFIFRAYHSVPLSVTDGNGMPVNALHGFARFIGDLVEQVGPTHVAVAFDERLASSYRCRLFPAYKANRESAPVELRRQFALCREFCRAFGVAEFSSEEYEADDIIGTLAATARAQDGRIVILTRDKDLAQLLRPGDEFWDYIGDIRYEYDDIERRFGVVPERLADFLALTGDAVDNIRGIPGIGRKTASLLLRHYATLDALYAGLEQIAALRIRNPGFVVGQLKDHRDAVYLARQLTQIYCNMSLGVEFDDLRRQQPDLAWLSELYDSAGFGRMLRNQAERIARIK